MKCAAGFSFSGEAETDAAMAAGRICLGFAAFLIRPT